MKILFTIVILLASIACGGGTEQPRLRLLDISVDTVKMKTDTTNNKTIKQLSPADSINQWLKDSLDAAEQGYWGC